MKTAPSAPPPPVVAPARALAFRARRHRVLGARAPAGAALDVVRDLVAVQAQLVPAAAEAIAARVEGFGLPDLRRALEEERSLVRGWSLRETAHVARVEDVPRIAAALATGWRDIERWFARRGLEPSLWPDLRAATLEALRKGPLGRPALRDVLARAAPGAEAFLGSWGGILRPLAAAGLVAFGPGRGRETTFVRLDAWVRGSPRAAPPRERAEEDLARRYLRAHGPASPADLAHWTGLRVSWAKAVLARLGPAKVATVQVAGKPLLVLAEDLPALAAPDRARDGRVRLLPAFDPYVLAHRDKRLYLDEVHRTRVFRPAAWVAPTVVAGGRVVGTWARQRGRRGDAIAVDLFEPLTRADERALAAEVRRAGARGS